jgi:hypothetical protein
LQCCDYGQIVPGEPTMEQLTALRCGS